MIKGLSEVSRVNVKGKISLGYKVIKAKCGKCGSVIARKTDDRGSYTCMKCDSPRATPIQGEREFTQSTPYFVLPEELKAKLGNRPKSIKVIPAYKELARVFPNSLAFYVNGKIFCSGDGEKARRYDKAKRDFIDIPCSKECTSIKDGRCKPSATFYIILPDVDIFSAYKVCPRSDISIGNILSELNKLVRGSNGDREILRTVYTLEIIERTRKSTGTPYHVLRLNLPQVTLEDARQGRIPAALDSQSVNIAAGAQDITGNEGEENITETIKNITPDKKMIALPKVTDIDSPERREKGRAMVKEKIKIFVKGQYVERALEIYSCERYKAGSYEDIPVKYLLELYKEIGKDSVLVNNVMLLATRLRHGVEEELPFLKTA